MGPGSFGGTDILVGGATDILVCGPHPKGEADRQECLSHHRQECLCHQRQGRGTSPRFKRQLPSGPVPATPEVIMPMSAPVRLGLCLALLALAFQFALPATARADAPATRPTSTASFTGEWKTTYGTMRLTQTGDAVEGTYGSAAQESTVRGTVAGR